MIESWIVLDIIYQLTTIFSLEGIAAHFYTIVHADILWKDGWMKFCLFDSLDKWVT